MDSIRPSLNYFGHSLRSIFLYNKVSSRWDGTVAGPRALKACLDRETSGGLRRGDCPRGSARREGLCEATS